MLSLLVTLIAGLFFLIGALIALFYKNNKNLISFSVGISFIVLIFLVIFDIFPEVLELFADYKILGIGGGIFVGIGTLMLLDKLVPHHSHHPKKEHNHSHRELSHIGIMTAIALIIHNLVEGMGIYGIALANLKMGIIYAFGVALHNIPFGIEITVMLKEEGKKNKMWIYLFSLTISTFVGGLLIFIFNDLLSDFMLGSLLSITIGMIIYIVFFELFFILKENFNKYSFFGILIGIILMLIGMGI